MGRCQLRACADGAGASCGRWCVHHGIAAQLASAPVHGLVGTAGIVTAAVASCSRSGWNRRVFSGRPPPGSGVSHHSDDSGIAGSECPTAGQGTWVDAGRSEASVQTAPEAGESCSIRASNDQVVIRSGLCRRPNSAAREFHHHPFLTPAALAASLSIAWALLVSIPSRARLPKLCQIGDRCFGALDSEFFTPSSSRSGQTKRVMPVRRCL